MPIRIPDLLPAVDLLNSENIFVMTETRAMHQDVRPLKVLLLNLMPKKIETENQLIRMLSNSPLQIDFELLRIDQTESKNTTGLSCDPPQRSHTISCFQHGMRYLLKQGVIISLGIT